jgi:sugar phosphate isomerase/epimerase
MQLSITSWSFPACTLQEAVGIARTLGIEALDLGYFYRAALDKAAILDDPKAVAARVLSLPVAVPSFYHLFGDTVADRNLADPAHRDANQRDFIRVVRFCRAANIPTIFVLPGIVNPGQSREAAIEASSAALGALVDIANGEGVTLTIEPHVHSLLQSPAQTRELIDRTPGLKLTLDHAHFVCMGHQQEDIDALVADAAHIHLRQARPGALQVKYHEGTIDFPALIGLLARVNYRGSLAIEYVHQAYMNTLFDDVLTETITMRDVVQACLAALPDQETRLK